MARSANFVSVIEGKTAVHLCAGCGFILPRTQVKYGQWREVSLPCIRAGCPLRLVDGMEAVAECPHECGAYDLFPELGHLVRRVHASAAWRDPPLPDAPAPDAAEALVCTTCMGFHARAPLPPERAPSSALFARGLELLVEHAPEAVRCVTSHWCAFTALKEARTSWMQFLPPSFRSALRLRSAAVRTQPTYIFASARLPLGEDDMAGIYDDSKMLMLDCESESCSGAALLDYPAAATLASVWESPKIKEPGTEQCTWVELSEATAHGGEVDTYYLHVLMNGLLVHRMPLYGKQPRPLVLSLTSSAPPSTYTTSNRGSIEGPLKPLIADIVGEIKHGKLQTPENFFLLSAQDILSAPEGATASASAAASEASAATASAAATEASAVTASAAASETSAVTASTAATEASAAESALAVMVRARADESDLRLARTKEAAQAYRTSLLTHLREARAQSSRLTLASLLRDSAAIEYCSSSSSSSSGCPEIADAAALLADIKARVRPGLLSAIVAAQPSRLLPRLALSVCAEDAWVSGNLDALEADLASGLRCSAALKLRVLLEARDLASDSVSRDRRLLASLHWSPTYLVNGHGAEVARGSSYGHLSDGAVFALSVFGQALRELHTAALKNSRINWKVPESFCDTYTPPVGLLIQAQGYVASRGGRIVGAEDQRSKRRAIAVAGASSSSSSSASSASGSSSASASVSDSHLMACLHLSSKTFFVDAGYVLSNQARYTLGVDPETEFGSVYEETELDAEVCVALVLPLALHEFAHAITRSTEHDEDFAGIMTILMTSAVCESTQERVLRHARELKAQLQCQRAELVQHLRAHHSTAARSSGKPNSKPNSKPSGKPSAKTSALLSATPSGKTSAKAVASAPSAKRACPSAEGATKSAKRARAAGEEK